MSRRRSILPTSRLDATRRRLVSTAGAIGAASIAWPATSLLAQAFPSSVIRIVPFGTAGGPIDGIARAYGEKLHARWGQPVVSEPRPGASGTIAANAVARATPDGHTVMFTLPLTHINNAILQPQLPYDPVKDFAPISQLATGGPMMVANASAPYSNVREFVDYARRNPGMKYGTWGEGSNAHLFCELLKRQQGLDLTHVPYKGQDAAHLDMYGKVIDFAWANPAAAKAQTQGGRMKVLGITGTQRVSMMPQVPTFTEQGFQGFDLDSWIGVYAPAGTPRPVIDAWTAALKEITRMPDVRERLIAFGFEPLGNGPEEFERIFRADLPRVAELIRGAGIQPAR